MACMMVGYHGFGGSPRQLRKTSQMDEVAARLGVAVTYAQSEHRFWQFWESDRPFRMERDLALFDQYSSGYDQTVVFGRSAGGNFSGTVCAHRPVTAAILYAAQYEAVKKLNWQHPRPPCLLLVNGNDGLVPPIENAIPLANWWGPNAQLEIGPEIDNLGGHAWNVEWATPLILKFLRQHLGLPITLPFQQPQPWWRRLLG